MNCVNKQCSAPIDDLSVCPECGTYQLRLRSEAPLTSWTDKLKEENKKLKEVIATHDLCHDCNLEVGIREFHKSCLLFIKNKFGIPSSNIALHMVGDFMEIFGSHEPQGDTWH